MGWFTRWFRSTHQPVARRPQTFRPTLETLEGRLMPTVGYYGGALLTNVAVQGLYIGDQWSNNTLSAQKNRFEGFLNTMVQSSYMDALTNAGYGVGRGSFTKGIVTPISLAPGSTLTDSSIRSTLSNFVNNGLLQKANSNTLYVCFVESNVKVADNDGTTSDTWCGYHTAFLSSTGALIRYAVVAYPGGTVNNAGDWFLSNIDSMTATASHEIAEAATDPDVAYGTKGWYDSDKKSEIGDLDDSVMYINGYAMQRLINKHDYVMTPSQATSNRAVNFLLQSNGTFTEVVNGVSTVLSRSAISMSPQGIDNQGHAMVDIVVAGGYAWEFHDTGAAGSWVYLGSGVKSAMAGQGVSYLLYSNGTVYEYDDATAIFTYRDSGVSSIDAGTDSQGVNLFAEIWNGAFWESSDDTGFKFIASGVKAFSAGRGGFSDYVTTAGVAHWHFDLYNQDATLFSGVSQVAAGTDANGNYMIDVLFTNGQVREYRSGLGWLNVASNTNTIGKGRLDALAAVVTGWAYEHNTGGWRNLGSSAVSVA